MRKLLIFCLFLDPGGDRTKFADQTEKRHHSQYSVCQIVFPLEKTLTGRTWKKMVVVVPTFTKGKKGYQGIVSAFVAGFEPFLSPQMGEGIDRKSGMV